MKVEALKMKVDVLARFERRGPRDECSLFIFIPDSIT